MVKCHVLFEVWIDFVSIIKTSVGFKGLNLYSDSPEILYTVATVFHSSQFLQYLFVQNVIVAIQLLASSQTL
jgi:hypothetical protein